MTSERAIEWTEPVALTALPGALAIPLLVTVPEAARLLSIGQTLAYEMTADGRLPSVRLGRSVRVPYDALRLAVENATRYGGWDGHTSTPTTTTAPRVGRHLQAGRRPVGGPLAGAPRRIRRAPMGADLRRD